MNLLILNERVQEFLRNHLNTDFKEISLKKSNFENITSAELATQLKGMQIAKDKFHFLFETKYIYYPPSLNLEQASSQNTAAYKASLANGSLAIDITAGMGIDAYFFSKNFEKVIAIDKNPELVEISKHNYKLLKAENIEYIHSDFEEFLNQNQNIRPDLIYLDPSRRNSSGRKFLIEDLEPDLTIWMEKLLNLSDCVMVKLSPLFDLKELIRKFIHIKEIHLVAVKNEMKELLLICSNEVNENPIIKAINLESTQDVFEFNFEDERNSKSFFSKPLKYVYEPNAAIMKSGAFKLIGQKFDLKKLEKSTHLYTSDKINPNFPGRIFEIIKEISNSKKEINGKTFHIISRNYPLTADEIRKKFKLKQSEKETLIFCTDIFGKRVLRCLKLA